MRVCVLTTSFPRWAGDEASVFVGKLVSAFSDADAAGVVVVPRDDREEREELWGKFVVLRYEYGIFSKGRLAFGRGILPNLRARPFLVFQIPGLLLNMLRTAYRKKEEWDVIHANWIVSGAVAYVLSLLTSRPYVVTIRGEDARLLSFPVLRFIFHFILRKADGVVSVNRAFLESMPHGAQCIPNGTEAVQIHDERMHAFYAERNIDAEKDYILFTGRVIPLKRVERLIEILTHEALQSTTLIILGRVEEEYGSRLRSLIESTGLQSRVRFEGSVPHHEIGYFLAVSKVYMSASSREGRSNAMLEALAAGVPVVASDIPGHAELITDGENGYLFNEQESSGEIARRVSSLLTDPSVYTTMSNRAKESVKDLTWQASAEAYLQLFGKIHAHKQ